MEISDWGKYANNLKTLMVHKQVSVVTDGGLEFDVTIPNVDNFPHKTRCMVMIDTLTISVIDDDNTDNVNRNNFAENYPELFSLPTVGVSMEGIGVMNSYDNINNQNSIVGYCPLSSVKVLSEKYARSMSFVYQNSGNIHTCGVLCQSPLGKSVRMRFHDLTIPQSVNESNLIKNTQRRVLSLAKATTSNSTVVTIVAATGSSSATAGNSSVKVGMDVAGTGYGGTPFTATVDAISGNSVTMSSAQTIQANSSLIFNQQPRTNVYNVTLNLKLLYLDNEDMKQV